MKTRFLIVAAFLFIAFASRTGFALAHDRTLSYSSWHISAQLATVVLTLNEVDVASLKLADSERTLDEYVISHLTLLADGKPCVVESRPRRLTGPAGRIRFQWNVVIPVGAPLDIRGDLFAESNPGHLHFACLNQTEGVTEHVLTSDERLWHIESGNLNSRRATPTRFNDYLLLGVKHIWSGYDHLVFLFALLLSGGMFSGLVRVVTGFTIGHSITLGMAAVGVLRPQGAPIEALIGVSIILVAVENVWLLDRENRLLPITTILLLAVLGGWSCAGFGRIPALCWAGMIVFLSCYYPLLHRSATTESARWIVALIFGLVHGFGFASVLQEAELPSDKLLGALVGFNLGVETGQLALVAIVWPWLLVALTRWRAAVVEVGSAFALLLGVYWMLGRNFL